MPISLLLALRQRNTCILPRVLMILISWEFLAGPVVIKTPEPPPYIFAINAIRIVQSAFKKL